MSSRSYRFVTNRGAPMQEVRVAQLDPAVRDYDEGGSGEEVTLRANEAAWRVRRFAPHVLTGVERAVTEVDLLGARLAAPVLVAPTALHGLVHPDGEVATARGAAAAGCGFVLSTRTSVPIEDVAAAAGPWWFQVYAMRDRALTLDLVAAAATSGAAAVVLTGDTPVVAPKRRPTPGVDPAAAHLAGLRARTGRDLTAVDVEQDPSAGTDLIRELGRVAGLPVLVKGVLRADDAARCLDAGAAGVIVSNHGGRQLDRAVATAEALPGVVAAVGGAAPVLVDGGIRTGADVLVALALGADAVLVGRPALRALAAGGADGVARMLRTLREELALAMVLAGVPAVTRPFPDVLHR
ncbi:4-hydroxymandelate oxidase [Amnibacterium kyonggiense]|uniref:4-hydroxymandelate oxidase n=1 Tax=Amnibacterium kyonggiense TaxID=595671 RepID=A0A4R7FE82_9MICO|nr:4-hydroxymandelate oxidase [Amnibacterium kyonggiense]